MNYKTIVPTALVSAALVACGSENGKVITYVDQNFLSNQSKTGEPIKPDLRVQTVDGKVREYTIGNFRGNDKNKGFEDSFIHVNVIRDTSGKINSLRVGYDLSSDAIPTNTYSFSEQELIVAIERDQGRSKQLTIDNRFEGGK